MIDLVGFETYKAPDPTFIGTIPNSLRREGRSNGAPDSQDASESQMRDRLIESPYLRSWGAAPLSTNVYF